MLNRSFTLQVCLAPRLLKSKMCVAFSEFDPLLRFKRSLDEGHSGAFSNF